MNEPRFVVRESTGYPIHGTTRAGNTNARLITEVMVIDRAYCHKVVWSSLTSVMETERTYPRRGRRGNAITDRVQRWQGTARKWSPEQRRAYAESRAAELNAWDAAL